MAPLTGWRCAAAAILAAGSPAYAKSASGPAIQGCEVTDQGLLVRWDAASQADYYELQLSSTAGGQMFAAVATDKTEAVVEDAVDDMTYFLRVRAHKSGTPSLGPGTWSTEGPSFECRTSKLPQRSSRGAREASSHGVETFATEMMRESEFTYDVDYLMNHNAGDVMGDVGFLTLTGSPGHPSFLNVTFTNATFTFYCVEVMKAQVPHTKTTLGNDTFADYLSCNDNGNATDPQCECDNWIDRVLGGLNPDEDCTNANGTACSASQFHTSKCTCKCTAESLEASSKYIGMMPVMFNNRTLNFGQWYSMPKGAECGPTEFVGTKRPDGSMCTWKRRSDMRVARGFEVISNGWNFSAWANSSAFPFTAPPKEQVAQNVQAVRTTLAKAPLKPWRCGGTAERMEAIVV